MITKSDYNNGFGKNDIIAITIILSVLLSKDMRISFINEIHSVFSLFKDITFSTGKTFFEMINLPNDFISRLDSLK